jgi:hypothetical protein
VGWSIDTDEPQLQVAKYTTLEEGFRPIEMPASIAQLDELTQQCKEVGNLVLNLVLRFPDVASFHQVSGR